MTDPSCTDCLRASAHVIFHTILRGSITGMMYLPTWGPGEAVNHAFCSLLATTCPVKSLPKCYRRRQEKGVSSLWILHEAWCQQRPSLRLCAEAPPKKETIPRGPIPRGGERDQDLTEHLGPATPEERSVSYSNTKFPC